MAFHLCQAIFELMNDKVYNKTNDNLFCINLIVFVNFL